MLGYFRERSGSWISKIIIGFVALLLAIVFSIGGFGPENKGPIATVNDQAITFLEYKDAYETLVERYRAQLGNNFDEKILEQLNIKKAALDRLIEEKLVYAAAEKFNIKVSKEELAKFIETYPYFQNDGQFSFETYKKILANNRLTPAEYEMSQKHALTKQKINDLLFSNVLVSDMELLEWQKFSSAKISIDYLKIDPSTLTEINPNQKEIKNYYIENKDQYKTDVKRNVEYLKFSLDDYKDNIKTDEKEIQQYYEENADLYSTPEQVEARHILIKTDENSDLEKVEKTRNEAMKIYELAIDGKNDFSELAKKYSQGPSSTNGGYLGIFAKQDMVKPFSEAAFAMKTGEISKPVKTMFGWHIIKLVNHFEPSIRTFNKVKGEIEKNIIEKKISDFAYYDVGAALDAVIDGDSLEQAGLLTNRKVIKAGPFSKNGIGLVLPNNKQFVEASFATPINEISDIVEIDDSYYLIKPVERIEPEIIEFEIVQDRVKENLISKQQYEKAEKTAGKILESVKEKKSLPQIVDKLNLKLNTTQLFDRKGYIPEIGYAPDITDAAFKLINKEEIYPEIIKEENIFYIISLKELSVPQGFKDNKEKANIKTKLENQKKRELYTAFVNSLKAESEIKIMMPEMFK